MPRQRGNVYQAHLESLRRAALFRELSDDDLTRLLRGATWCTYRHSELIAAPEELYTTFLVIVRGLARLHRTTPDGQPCTVDLFQAGDACGILVPDPAVQPRSVLEALTDNTLVCRLPLRQVRDLLEADPDLARTALGLAQARLARAYGWHVELACHDAKTRLAHMLARLARTTARQDVLAEREELAALIGANREEVTRGLRSPRERGLIDFRPHKRGIVVRDPEQLAAFHHEKRPM